MNDIINSPRNSLLTSPNNLQSPDVLKRLAESKEIEDEGEFIDYNNVTGLRITDNNKLNKFNDIMQSDAPLRIQDG